MVSGEEVERGEMVLACVRTTLTARCPHQLEILLSYLHILRLRRREGRGKNQKGHTGLCQCGSHFVLFIAILFQTGLYYVHHIQ